ncbi:MAG TPA: LapA family protein [Candidatus Methylomirabilis sp.]|nr:LapA family protein [Candidatus Methylomirabilis sp.]
MKHFYFTVGLILGLGVAVFAMQNTLGIEVRFLVWQVQAPLAVVVLASAATGALVVLLFSLPAILRGRWRIRSLERRLEPGGEPTGADTTVPRKETGEPGG